MSATTTQWENEVVSAWGKEPGAFAGGQATLPRPSRPLTHFPTDCAPSTGMCNACGIGATVVEIDDAGKTAVRSIMAGPNDQAAPFDYDEATFEIASYTKHFTALSMVNLEIQIHDFSSTTIGKWLPCDWESAAYSGTANITLQQLRLHTSGLPPQAPNHNLAGGNGNPFAGYTQEMLCDSLLRLTALPSQGRFVYSNYAYGALGYALQFAASSLKPGQDIPTYEEVIKESVLIHLDMNNTSVTLDQAGWEKAAVGCNRGISRGAYAIRRGTYGVLQGNGALRSTLPDMSKFLAVSLLVEEEFLNASNAAQDLTPHQQIVYDAIKHLGTQRKEACTCVSGWCEGNLCPLPNPVKELITDSGATAYTSGGISGKRKSGDTEGFSVRGCWSIQKHRAVFVVDTCGGCGERGTSGSAAQRVALLLADGPPDEPNTECADTEGDGSYRVEHFVGTADSHIYPSIVDIEVKVEIKSGGAATISVASSDGAGCTAAGRAVEDGWEFDTSVLYGCGFGGDDPLAAVPQKRSLRLLDGGGAILQEMGEDIYLTLKGNDSPRSSLGLTSPMLMLMSLVTLFISFFAIRRK